MLLAAHARGLVGYWRTPGVLRTPEGREALGIGDDEHVLGLIYLGPQRQEQEPPEQAPARRVRNVPRVISRADALTALEREEFDLVVVGGGITGAGVALDAASRGYSVALLERSRLRGGHLQPLVEAHPRRPALPAELRPGLVREALLERSLMVKLAPHLVRPLPLLVPSFEGKRPDRLMGMGLNMYDAMSLAPLARRGRRGLEPRSPPHDRRRRGRGDGACAGRAQPERGVPLLRLPDRRRAPRAHRARRGGALRGRARQPAARSPGWWSGPGARPVCWCATRSAATSSRSAPTTSINATGVWADQLRPDELYREEEVPRIRPSRGTHVTISREGLPVDTPA